MYTLENSAIIIHDKCDMISFLFLTAYYFARLYIKETIINIFKENIQKKHFYKHVNENITQQKAKNLT